MRNGGFDPAFIWMLDLEPQKMKAAQYPVEKEHYFFLCHEIVSFPRTKLATDVPPTVVEIKNKPNWTEIY